MSMLHNDSHRDHTDLVQASIEKPPPPKPRQRKRKEIDVVDDKTQRLQKRMVGIAHGAPLVSQVLDVMDLRPAYQAPPLHLQKCTASAQAGATSAWAAASYSQRATAVGLDG